MRWEAWVECRFWYCTWFSVSLLSTDRVQSMWNNQKEKRAILPLWKQNFRYTCVTVQFLCTLNYLKCLFFVCLFFGSICHHAGIVIDEVVMLRKHKMNFNGRHWTCGLIQQHGRIVLTDTLKWLQINARTLIGGTANILRFISEA